MNNKADFLEHRINNECFVGVVAVTAVCVCVNMRSAEPGEQDCSAVVLGPHSDAGDYLASFLAKPCHETSLRAQA